MSQADDIKRRYEQARIDTLDSRDKAVLEKMKEIYLQESKAEPKTAELSVWRIIMKSKITKLAAAAAVVLLFSLFSINILIKRFDIEHVVTKSDTSPRYILIDSQNNYLNQKEIMPCNILPVPPSQF
jgi:UDP-glucose 6-dehydrogenase